MAEINFQGYKTQPFYLEHDFGEFYGRFNSGRSRIEGIGERFLEESIKIQEKKEKDIYKILGLQEGNWEEIGTQLYGVFDINDKNKKIINNKLELFLKTFTKLINESINKGIKAKKEYENGGRNVEELVDIINEFIKIYNNPAEEYLSWYNTSDLKEGELQLTELEFLNDLFKKSRQNRENLKIPGDNENRLKNITEKSLQDGLDFLFSASGIISNIIGAIGEQATISLLSNGKEYLKKAVGTSILSGESEQRDKIESIKNQNINFYADPTTGGEEKRINKELEAAGIKLSTLTDDGLLKFGLTYSKTDTGTLSKNLKADEIFTFKFKLDTGKPVEYGISSKTSWTENGIIKIYSGSFYSAFENMFKSSIINAGEIGEVVNFLIYSIFNSYGVGTYGNYRSEKGRDLEETLHYFNEEKTEYLKYEGRKNKKMMYTTISSYKEQKEKKFENGKVVRIDGKVQYDIIKIPVESYSTFLDTKIKPLYNLIIQEFAYQWFTGGISPATHADFFSVYSNDKHYFIPMSIILKTIQKLTKENIFPITNELLSFKEKNPLSLQDYKDSYTYTYKQMEELALNNLKYGKDKGGSKSIKIDKGIIFENLHK